VFGLAGLLFAASLNRTKQYLAARISHPVARIGIIGVIASCPAVYYAPRPLFRA